MRLPLIVKFFQLLPQPGPDIEPKRWARLYRKAIGKFERSVAARYTEASLERLLHAPLAEVRQAAALGLGLLGSMQMTPELAARLHDEDLGVSEMAADALWSIWFRADTPETNDELQRLMHMVLTDASAIDALRGFDALIRRSPRFAEAYNQRAILWFRLGEYAKSIADCEKVLRLNPYHFGAASGMAQRFMKQKKLRAALRSYRRANRINPRLDGVRQVIASLEKMLGEEGKR